jgi:hypothetical protein
MMRTFLVWLLLVTGACHHEFPTSDSRGKDLDGPRDLVVDVVRDRTPDVGSTFLGSKRFGGAGEDRAQSVAVDVGHSVTITGYFEGTVDFGGGLLQSAGGADVFIVSYDALTGTHRWSTRLGGQGRDWGHGVAVDGDGNVTVVGFFEGTADFSGGPLTSAGAKDIFVASYNPAGNHRWTRRLGGAGDDYAQGVAVDTTGNVIVTGWFEQVVDFGEGNVASAGGADIFIVRLGFNGGHLWSKHFGGVGTEWGFSAAADSSGNVTVTGRFNAPMDVGGGVMSPASAASDIFIASYDPLGVHRWSKRFGGAGEDWSAGVAVDSTGNVTVTGFFSQTVDFGGGPLTSAGAGDIFVASYGSQGAYRWSSRFGSTADDFGRGVAIDGSDNVIVTGACEGVVDLGGGALAGAGSRDVFVASWGPTGGHRWSRRFGGTDMEWGFGVASGGSSVGTMVVGQFAGVMDLGGEKLTSMGGADVFVLRLAP